MSRLVAYMMLKVSEFVAGSLSGNGRLKRDIYIYIIGNIKLICRYLWRFDSK